MLKKVFAQSATLPVPLPEGLFPKITFDTLFERALTLILVVISFVAFFAIIYSGIMMITSGGDTAKFATARKNIIWTVIGLIVAVLSLFIIGFIFNFTTSLT